MAHSKFHYCPPDGYVGDVIPFYWQGQYHVMYLEGQFDPWRRVRYTPFRHLVSTDLVNWSELPLALPLGGPDDVDMSLGTGTIIERDGTFYLLYCGRVFQGERQGDHHPDDPHWETTSFETVCLATSTDLVHWTKDPANPILRPDGQVYALNDFRDPFPFWNEDEGCYWMLIAAKVTGHVQPGALALATSTDLLYWQLREPFYAPNLSPMPPECPDIFQADGRWYHYSSSDGRTMLRFADSLAGPWQRPHVDLHDHWNVYALKTIFDGHRRFLMGWLATKEGNRDNGPVQWGGNLIIPRQLVPLPAGPLAERCPQEILNACGEPLAFECTPRLGRWSQQGGLHAERRDGFADATLEGLPERALLEFDVIFDEQAFSQGAAGVLFRASPDLGTYYALDLEPGRHRVAIERWPHCGEFSVLVERPLDTAPGERVHVQLFIDGDIAEAFVNNHFALACRIYDFPSGKTSLFAEFGAVDFHSLQVRKLPMP
jgi:beta-fructofuranosidase